MWLLDKDLDEPWDSSYCRGCINDGTSYKHHHKTSIGVDGDKSLYLTSTNATNSNLVLEPFNLTTIESVVSDSESEITVGQPDGLDETKQFTHTETD
jgi:hypothetical protein